MAGEIFGLTPMVQDPNPRGRTTVFARLLNLRSKSTENRALTPSRAEAEMMGGSGWSARVESPIILPLRYGF